MNRLDYIENRLKLMEAFVLGFGQIMYDNSPPVVQDAMNELRQQWADEANQLIQETENAKDDQKVEVP